MAVRILLSLVLFFSCSDQGQERFDVSQVKFNRQKGYNASELLHSKKILQVSSDEQENKSNVSKGSADNKPSIKSSKTNVLFIS